MVLGLAHIEFASKDRLDALGLGSINKMHGPIDVPVVRHRDRLLPQRSNAINELMNVASPVKERVFGVQVQVCKFSHGLLLFYREASSRYPVENGAETPWRPIIEKRCHPEHPTLGASRIAGRGPPIPSFQSP